MHAKDAIKINMDMGQFISLGYLEDLNDQELLHRPAKGANHINWQLGHLIASEHDMIEKVAPGTMPPLPARFTEIYTKESAASDDASKFLKKDELLKAYHEQRAGTLKALAAASDADMDKATGVEYAPNVAAMYSMQGTHWVMHAGQWAVVRRQLGRKPMF
jgi:hypothetical protein